MNEYDLTVERLEMGIVRLTINEANFLQSAKLETVDVTAALIRLIQDAQEEQRILFLNLDLRRVEFLSSQGLSCLKGLINWCRGAFSPVITIDLASIAMLKIVLFVRFEKLVDEVHVNGVPFSESRLAEFRKQNPRKPASQDSN